MAGWTMIIILAFLCIHAAGAAAEHKPSAYETLRRYNFPAGLLPEGATGYTLDRATGEFTARLNGSCSFTLENSYELRYQPVIRGVISEGRLRKLSGISVRVVVVWLSIVEVRRKDEDLEFSVGFTTADFPVRNFEECPRCGCGLQCGEENWSSSSSS